MIKGKDRKGFEFPVGKFKYDDYGQMVWDSDTNLMPDIRGWGTFQYMEDGQKRMDEFGQWVVDAMNEKLDRESKGE